VIAALAFMIAAAQATKLAIAPWTGKSPPTATSAAAKYRLLVSGEPNATVQLQASGVASGWIAAFCTDTVCAPMRVSATLPASGQAVYQFELIRESDDATPSSGATITAGDATLTVPAVRR
jgi:hypothetical protein